jgi:hypothetical protein
MNEPTESDDIPDDDRLPTDGLARIEKIERDLALGAIGRDLGLTSEQAGAVYDLSRRADLDPAEALGVLRMRDPEKFGGTVASAPTYGGLRAGAAPRSKPPESDWKERLAYTRQLAAVDKRRHGEYANNLAGKFLAKALGWEHHALPLPPNDGRR